MCDHKERETMSNNATYTKFGYKRLNGEIHQVLRNKMPPARREKARTDTGDGFNHSQSSNDVDCEL